jgi:uncharacterized damage-inducible protein DinB
VKLNELFIADLDREVPATRRVLDRVPEGRFDWKPHPKSMPLGNLSILVATMPSWVEFMVNLDEFDFMPGGKPHLQPDLRTAKQLVQAFDESMETARTALTHATDEHLITTWRLKAAGHLVSELPRHVNIRDGIINHLAHHRGQMTVYLRLSDAMVPSVYGPSADERF